MVALVQFLRFENGVYASTQDGGVTPSIPPGKAVPSAARKGRAIGLGEELTKRSIAVAQWTEDKLLLTY